MVKYKFSSINPNGQFLDIALSIPVKDIEKLSLKLPAWRPGRYQMQYFAKNIRAFKAFDEKGNSITFSKSHHSIWEINTRDSETIEVQYQYSATQMDAGGTYLSNDLWLLNFITCCFEVDGYEGAYSLGVKLPESWDFVSSLPREKYGDWVAESFYQLTDSPLMAAPVIQSYDYTVDETVCFVDIIGDIKPDWSLIVEQFKAFTIEQRNLFGSLPMKEYHFMILVLPYRHYHGVEHRDSTVIVLGPDIQWQDKLYEDFLGVSSHELFHAWNVCRLRPKEMVPYQYQSENYHTTGFVTEGVTTYYGDLMLCRSGVWTVDQYLVELNKLLKRHFQNEGRHFKSVADSSFDLWLDGYEKGIPGAKTSIYVKGALCTFILDMMMINSSNAKHSFDEVLQDMWGNYGQSEIGYTADEFIESIKHYLNIDLPIVESLYYGTVDLTIYLKELLPLFGLQLSYHNEISSLASDFGVKVEAASLKVMDIHPDSEAIHHLQVGDILVAINGKKAKSEWIPYLLKETDNLFHVFRNDQLHELSLSNEQASYWSVMQVSKRNEPLTKQQQLLFDKLFHRVLL